MATSSGWSRLVPSGSSAVASGDDEIRSTKSYLEKWIEDEHYVLDGSAASAGVHKTGSGRIYSQSAQPTAVAPKGQMWHDSDDDNVYVHNGSDWTFLASGSLRTTALNTWSGTQRFSYATASDLSASVATITTLIAANFTPSSGISASAVTGGRFGKPGGEFIDIVSFTSANAAVRGLGSGDILTLTFQHASGLTLSDVVMSSFTYNNAGGTRRLTWSSSVQQSDGSVILTILAPTGGSNSTASIDVGNTFRFVGFRTA